MKAASMLLLLVSMALAKQEKIKVSLAPPVKKEKKGLAKKDLPDDIKQGERFLEQSKKDFDQVQKMSAMQAMQNNILNQSLDLSIPRLENDLKEEGLAPVRQLELKSEDKGESKNRRLNDDDEEEKEEEDEGGDEDKLDDVEKRLFSIEDKIDHLLLHAGHEVSPHAAVLTPWGLHFAPSKQNPNSLHNKLKMVDYLFGNHAPMGAMGMGMGLGYGMGGHMMGIGHMNPMGYGLDHHASMKYGMYPYHQLHPVHPLHTFSPYGMYSPYHTIMGHHPVYGNLGYGMMSNSRYRDELEEQRHERYMRHQRDMDEIMSKPLLPSSLEKPTQSSSSFFLI